MSRIGNLFNHENYLNLPHVIPTASLQLAAELLRENGVEPRPEFFTLTVVDIVHRMKKFLGIFAWNIIDPDKIITESVDQILQVLRMANQENSVTTGMHHSASQHRDLHVSSITVALSAVAIERSPAVPAKSDFASWLAEKMADGEWEPAEMELCVSALRSIGIRTVKTLSNVTEQKFEVEIEKCEAQGLTAGLQAELIAIHKNVRNNLKN